MSTRAEWPVVCIKEVCESVIDCVNKTAPTVEYPTPYKMIRTTNVRDGWINLDEVRFVDAEVFARWNRRATPRKGDVILTREAPLGEVGMLRSNDQVFLGQRLVLYRADPLQLDNRFLLYSFRFDYLQGQIKSLGSGATVEHMRVPDAEKLLLRLPSLPIQRRIGDTLSAYDDLIENNTRRIKILEEMAKMIYREWFVNFRFPGHEKAKMVESENGPIPKEWLIGRLGDIMALKSGFAFKSSTFDDTGTYGLVTIRNVHDGHFSPECESRIAEVPSNLPTFCRLQSGDVLMSLTGNVGRTCLAYGSNLLLNQRVAKVIPRRESDLAYIYCLLRMPEARTRLEQISTGVAQQNLSPVKAMEEEMAIPSVPLRNQFSEAIQPIVDAIVNFFVRNTILRTTRDLILPKLISGEVTVEQFEAESVAQGV